MEQSPLIQIGLPIALLVIMGGMGLTLAPRDFRRVLAAPRAAVLGSLAQVAIFPALAFAIAHAMRLPPELSVGLVILAACPGGATSNVFTFLARGHLALSISVTVAASVLTVFTVPLFASLALSVYLDGDVDATLRLPLGQTIGALFLLVVVPVLAGMMIRARRPDLASRAEGPISSFGILVLVCLIVGLVWETRDDLIMLLSRAGPAVTLLSLSGIAVGFATSLLRGVSRVDGLTLAIEMAIKNAFMGLMVTLTLLDSYEMAIPAAVYGVIMYGFGAALTFLGRRCITAHRTPMAD